MIVVGLCVIRKVNKKPLGKSSRQNTYMFSGALHFRLVWQIQYAGCTESTNWISSLYTLTVIERINIDILQLTYLLFSFTVYQTSLGTVVKIIYQIYRNPLLYLCCLRTELMVQYCYILRQLTFNRRHMGVIL